MTGEWRKNAIGIIDQFSPL